MRFQTSLVHRIISIIYRFLFAGHNELKAHIIEPHATYKIKQTLTMFEQFLSLLFYELHKEHSKTRCHDCMSMADNATTLCTNTHVRQYSLNFVY